jgi:hypothetical protein
MSEDIITIIIGATTGILAGILSSAVTALFMRRKTRSEAEKLIAEAKHIQAETDIIIHQNNLSAIKELIARIEVLESENSEHLHRIDELESNEIVWKNQIRQLESEVKSLFKKFTAYCVGNRKLINQIERSGQIPVWTPAEIDA